MSTIIFVLGPSGVGKSLTSDGLENAYSFLHIDIDKKGKCGFKPNGFPREWDTDISSVDFALLAIIARDKQAGGDRAHAVVSFPTTYIFSPEQLEAASREGIATVVLWGTKEHCIEARKARAKQNGVKFNLEDYEQKNKRTFETYSQPGYADLRIETFKPDGSRLLHEDTLAMILKRCIMSNLAIIEDNG